MIYGDHQDNTLAQFKTCQETGPVVASALLADGHLGYAMPIGGVIAYDGAISPSGVGFDIGCGVRAESTPLAYGDIRADLPMLADRIYSEVAFGLGRRAATRVAHEVMDDPLWDVVDSEVRGLRDLAANQLGTVGSGNHYVDIVVESDEVGAFDDASPVWIVTHFGSRGLGHKIATRYLDLAGGRDGMMVPPAIITEGTPLFDAYLPAMELAGNYARAGRLSVVRQVREILGAGPTSGAVVENHHNFAWKENDAWVVRKGATPAHDGQQGYVGGSMCDLGAIVVGAGATETVSSTVHGAGRVMGRAQAIGKVDRKTGEVKRAGLVSPEMMEGAIANFGTVLRGGGVDESPFVYRPLSGVIAAMGDTVRVSQWLRPIMVCMAGKDVRDPYKD